MKQATDRHVASPLFLLNAACLAEKQQIPMLFPPVAKTLPNLVEVLDKFLNMDTPLFSRHLTHYRI
jgi:hypothetical protein